MRAFPLALTTLLISVGPLPAQNSTAPPVAPKVPKVDTLHGEVRVDNYFWLREKTNPEVIRYQLAELPGELRVLQDAELLPVDRGMEARAQKEMPLQHSPSAAEEVFRTIHRRMSSWGPGRGAGGRARPCR